MKSRIYLFANFGDWNKQPYGGGEVGNRRTLQLLKKCGYDIRLIEKYQRVKNHSFPNKCLLLLKMITNICYFFFVLLFGRRKKSIVHIVGFYGPMVYFERVLVYISKTLGYKTVYEMRGGGAADYYANGGKRYKKFFDAIINDCDCVFSQGLENYSLIDTIDSGKDRFYYPNYVMPDFAPASYPEKPNDKVNLFYFGRISETKNVDVILKSMSILSKSLPDVYLSVLGNYSDKAYYDSLVDYVEKNGLKDKVRFFPACNHDKLKEFLKDKHFYLFPTSEPHEGHSNAMTEAMAWGLIPIATRQGFNRSVVGNDDLIVTELSAEAFAANVVNIVNNDLIDEYSKAVYNRVRELYCSDKVYKSLNRKYDQLFGDGN